MARSELRVIVVVSVSLLLPAASVTPAGALTVAVLDSVPVAEEATVPLTVNVAVPPERRLTEAAMLPVPEAGQDEPLEAVQVQAAPVKAAGKVSATEAPTTSEGPLLVTTIV